MAALFNSERLLTALYVVLLGLHARWNVAVAAIGGFHGGELSQAADGFLQMPCGGAMAVVLHGPHFLPGERWMMSLVAAEQRPLLPVVGPHLQNGLFERTCGERVEDGVQGAVDGENKYDHPGADSTCRVEAKGFGKAEQSQCFEHLNSVTKAAKN